MSTFLIHYKGFSTDRKLTSGYCCVLRGTRAVTVKKGAKFMSLILTPPSGSTTLVPTAAPVTLLLLLLG